MLIFISNVIFWVIFVYGFLSLAQDIFYEITYKKIDYDMKVFVLIKSFENKIDELVNEFSVWKKYRFCKNIILVNLNKNDNFKEINKRLKMQDINWKVLGPNEGEDIIMEYLKNSKKEV